MTGVGRGGEDVMMDAMCLGEFFVGRHAETRMCSVYTRLYWIEGEACQQSVVSYVYMPGRSRESYVGGRGT